MKMHCHHVSHNLPALERFQGYHFISALARIAVHCGAVDVETEYQSARPWIKGHLIAVFRGPRGGIRDIQVLE